MSWKKLDYLINERKKVVSFIDKNVLLIAQQKPHSQDILSPEPQHIQHHDEDYSPPTIIDNIPVSSDNYDEQITQQEVQDNNTNTNVQEDIQINPPSEQQDNITEDIPIVEIPEENPSQDQQDNLEDPTNNNNLLFI